MSEAPITVYGTVEDLIERPDHYTTGGIETISFIEAKLTDEEMAGYLIGNVIKYVSRWRHKGGAEDLKKARWYLGRLIDREA